jgi:hypothetical protein
VKESSHPDSLLRVRRYPGKSFRIAVDIFYSKREAILTEPSGCVMAFLPREFYHRFTSQDC